MRFQYVVLLLLCIPMTSFASVHINEVAWMGTTNSANDEWIELYNSGPDTVDLSGWTLSANDGSPTINLEGSISGNGYFLLERTDDSSVSTVDADQIYSGALGNDGEVLTLTDSSGSVQDTVNHSGGWLGGDNTTKDTMQYDGSGWITAAPTPRSQNISGSNADSENDNTTGGNSHDSDTESSNSVHNEQNNTIDYFKLNVHVDPVIISGVPAEFIVNIYKNGVRKIDGIHSWNFGDGTAMQEVEHSRKGDMEFHHTYHNAGTYVAIFEYRTSHLKKEPDIRHRVDVIVTDHNVTISHVVPNKSITLSNITGEEIDIGSWRLRTGTDEYQFPANTILLPHSETMFSYQALDIPIQETTVLMLPDKTVVGRLVSNAILGVASVSVKKSDSDVVIHADDTTVVRPLDATATVMFANDRGDNKGNNVVWYLVAALIVVIGVGISIVGYYVYTTKTPTSDDVGVDDITILED